MRDGQLYSPEELKCLLRKMKCAVALINLAKDEKLWLFIPVDNTVIPVCLKETKLKQVLFLTNFTASNWNCQVLSSIYNNVI